MFTRLSAAQNNILKHLLLTGVAIDSDLWYLSERRLKPVCISPRIEVNLELSLFFFFFLDNIIVKLLPLKITIILAMLLKVIFINPGNSECNLIFNGIKVVKNKIQETCSLNKQQ